MINTLTKKVDNMNEKHEELAVVCKSIARQLKKDRSGNIDQYKVHDNNSFLQPAFNSYF